MSKVFTILENSENFKKHYTSIKDIWISPDKFIEYYKDYIVNNMLMFDGDFWVLIFGYEGSGKSSLSLMIYSNFIKDEDEFIKNMIFSQTEYAKRIHYFVSNNIKKSCLLIDDAHYVFGKYYTLTKETLSILQLARFIRDQQIIHILNTQTPNQLYRDIWYERINNFIYCFKEKYFDENENKFNFNLYAATYLNSYIIKNNIDDWRNVSNWRFLLSKYPPDVLTRINDLFEKYSSIYNKYKQIKKFYKEFYSLFRFKEFVKGNEFELLFRLVKSIATNNFNIDTFPKKFINKLIEKSIIDENFNIIDEDVKKLIENNKDIIIKKL